jgi:uncharacterized protein with NRDE domain
VTQKVKLTQNAGSAEFEAVLSQKLPFLYMYCTLVAIMCILLVTTRHPSYAYVILNNRDEFLTRPTARATWWTPPLAHVLGGRDLQREVQGTWLGITKQGRLAVLTNFREECDEVIQGARSRGELPKMFLGVATKSTETPKDFAKRLVEGEGVSGVGGFSLVFGQLRKPSSMLGHIGIVSNRMKEAEEVKWTERGTWGLSNSHYGDRTWPKVVQGEALLEKAAARDLQDEEAFLEQCFALLSTDTLPKQKEGQEWTAMVKELRNSIFIPKLGGDAGVEEKAADEIAAAKKEDKHQVSPGSGPYGTQKQTVILVSHDGKVTFVERALYDGEGKPVRLDDRDTKIEFEIEGWS